MDVIIADWSNLWLKWLRSDFVHLSFLKKCVCIKKIRVFLQIFSTSKLMDVIIADWSNLWLKWLRSDFVHLSIHTEINTKVIWRLLKTCMPYVVADWSNLWLKGLRSILLVSKMCKCLHYVAASWRPFWVCYTLLHFWKFLRRTQKGRRNG